uniref:Protein Wnt n=1 Tax=Neogobius melanostomus TaxID=47308 RepID=A0A8C6UTB9_9GOBI
QRKREFVCHAITFKTHSLARLPRSRPLSGDAPCARLRGLTPGQVGVCRARGEVMESVRKAAEMCQHQFRNRRWNLRLKSQINTLSGAGTREAAFVHALSSAAVAVAVTRACTRGELERVGVVLKERFDGATEVQTQVRLTRIGSRTALLPRDPQVKPPAARDLLYLAPSPDFCHLDPDNGIPGTAGRRCNGKRTSRLAPDGCELVCCGPGYRAGRAEVVQRCSCKFSWCCSVRCQQCKNTVTIHTCRV